MNKATLRMPSSHRLSEANPGAMKKYQAMRAELTASPVIDERTNEIVLTVQFAALGHEVPFKIHALRAIAQGVTTDQLRAMLMLGLGVTLVACETARALSWLDEATACDDTTSSTDTNV